MALDGLERISRLTYNVPLTLEQLFIMRALMAPIIKYAKDSPYDELWHTIEYKVSCGQSTEPEIYEKLYEKYAVQKGR